MARTVIESSTELSREFDPPDLSPLSNDHDCPIIRASCIFLHPFQPIRTALCPYASINARDVLSVVWDACLKDWSREFRWNMRMENVIELEGITFCFCMIELLKIQVPIAGIHRRCIRILLDMSNTTDEWYKYADNGGYTVHPVPDLG